MEKIACPITRKSEFERQLALLRTVKTIAVIGMSPDPKRPSNEVGLYLRKKGYKIVPIHPTATKIDDLIVYPDLEKAVQAVGKPDLVDLFVGGEKTRLVVEQAKRLDIGAVWFQPGAEHLETEQWARENGLQVVTGACTMAVLERAGQ